MVGFLQSIAPFVPETLKGVLGNCGGTNLKVHRFAGNLDHRVSDEDFLGIFHSLIFPNGVRKTTQLARNESLAEALLQSPEFPTGRKLRVLDVAASAGLDALATRAKIAKTQEISRYVLGDLHTTILYDRARGLVFDADHNLLQVKRRGHFVSVNFAYNYSFQKLTNAPKRIRPWLLERRFKFDPASDVIAVQLVHPDVDVAGPTAPFQLKRMNVFDPIDGEFDLIFCLHLLVPRYFSAETIARGTENLGRALSVGGVLVVGSREAHRMLIRRESGVEELRSSR